MAPSVVHAAFRPKTLGPTPRADRRPFPVAVRQGITAALCEGIVWVANYPGRRRLARSLDDLGAGHLVVRVVWEIDAERALGGFGARPRVVFPEQRRHLLADQLILGRRQRLVASGARVHVGQVVLVVCGVLVELARAEACGEGFANADHSPVGQYKQETVHYRRRSGESDGDYSGGVKNITFAVSEVVENCEQTESG